jgi:glycosyltransferase involved in cell wall biosynthesis
MPSAPRVVHLSQSDSDGGAARAAFRLHLALHQHGVDSILRVSDAQSGHWTVRGPATRGERLGARIRPAIGRLLVDRLVTGNPVLHSPAIAPTHWSGALGDDPDRVVHLHWVQKEFLSIADLGRLRGAAVWTLHDMWAFCGAEHYAADERWRAGYRADNRPPHEAGFDLNRWTWKRKQRHWTRPLQLVCPSRWLADCVRASALMHDWPVRVIPNPIDTGFWRPVAKRLARELLGLPPDAPLLVFSAHGGSRDPRKGFAQLREALVAARAKIPNLELLVCGQSEPREPDIPAMRAHYLGALHDDVSLRLAYSAADALVIPSQLDNLPNSGVEALACGTPVVAFEVGGLPDIVLHRRNGFLAPPRDAAGLADGISWVLAEPARQAALGQAAREHAERTFSNSAVLPAMLDVYRQVVDRQSSRRPTTDLPGAKTE